MINKLIFCFLSCALISCQEIIEFDIEQNEDVVIIDGNISDQSYNDMVASEGNGRYFTIKVRKGKPVNSYIPVAITDATVTLEISDGTAINLKHMEDGIYSICDQDFKAQPNTEYRIVVSTLIDQTISSEWVSMPNTDNVFQGIDYKIESRSVFDQTTQTTIKELTLVYSTLVNGDTEHTNYYTWDFESAWVYMAPLAAENSPFKKCFIESSTYLRQFPLAQSSRKSKSQELVDLTLMNGRLAHEFSILATQKAINKDFFYYLSGIKQQMNRGSIFDSPPYNLSTNIKASNGQRAAGFFTVIKESPKRWYTNLAKLGYHEEGRFDLECYPPMPPVPASCYNCTNYRGGSGATIVKPTWWRF